MNRFVDLSRLLKIGVLTSLLLGMLMTSPVLVMSSIKAGNLVLVFSFSFLILLSIWSINVLLINELSGSLRTQLLRIFLSYLMVITLIVILRLNLDFPIDQARESMRSQLPSLAEIPFRLKIFAGVLIGFTLNSLVLIFLELIVLRNKKAEIEEQVALLRSENLEASNLALKQQIQPHFLFNALNTLDSLFSEQPSKASQYLLSLSDFLRASIGYSNSDTISIAQEFELSLNYLWIQKTRFADAFFYSIHIDEPKNQQGALPPFSIQLLLENAIKHNTLTAQEPLHVKIYDEDGWISVVNNLQRRKPYTASMGVGLANLNARYRLLSNTDIRIEEGGNEFKVSIKIL